MFEDIEIRKFRGIKSLEINSLARINLFVGDNNCGKSSLLEALFLLSGPTYPALDININTSREYTGIKEKDLSLLFYGYEFTGNNVINICAKNNEFNWKLAITPYEKIVEDNELLDSANINNQVQVEYGLKNYFLLSNDIEESLHYENIIRIQQQTDGQERINLLTDKIEFNNPIFSKFLSPKHIFKTSIAKLKEIKEQKDEHKIISVINKIEPKIIGIDYIGDSVFVDIGINRLVPINMMGDGIRKLLSIIVSMHECKDGMIFIDEIDNGFHYSKMPLLWETVIEAANQLNVQVFATTHNIDSLKGLAKILSDEKMSERRDDVLTFYLQHLQDDTVKPYEYKYENFEFLINQGVEIR
jgi:AAA15 family ATPase/GTPase